MKKISNAYREAMNQKIRNLGYISVSLGIVNGDAQSSAQFSGEYTYWSNKRLPFGNDLDYIEYATLENNYMRVDGDMYFLPRNNEYMQLKNAPLTTNDIMGVVTVEFPSEMSIKGITIDFGRYYPSCIFSCGNTASPAGREPPVRANGNRLCEFTRVMFCLIHRPHALRCHARHLCL